MINIHNTRILDSKIEEEEAETDSRRQRKLSKRKRTRCTQGERKLSKMNGAAEH